MTEQTPVTKTMTSSVTYLIEVNGRYLTEVSTADFTDLNDLIVNATTVKLFTFDEALQTMAKLSAQNIPSTLVVVVPK